jgi:hypothetical protein
MILVELMFVVMLAVAALLIVPVMLLMAGVAGVLALWALAPGVLLVGLLLWILFPHAVGMGLLFVIAILAVLALEHRSRRTVVHRWY